MQRFLNADSDELISLGGKLLAAWIHISFCLYMYWHMGACITLSFRIIVTIVRVLMRILRR